MQSAPPGLNAMRHMEQCLEALANTTMTAKQKLTLLAIVDDFVFGHALREAANEKAMAGLGAPLVTFCWFDIAPGRNKDFEIAITKALAADRSHVSSHMLLRPIDGSSRYLLVFSALKSSVVKQHADFLARLVAAVVQNSNAGSAVLRVDTETARFRSDMSYRTDLKGR